MSGLLLLALSAFGGGVELTLAPDQPVPHVYVDDPLIVEVRSDQDAQATVTLEVGLDWASTPATVSLGQIALRANGTHWRAIEGIPMERGRYRVRAHIEIEGTETTQDARFCRIDRPAPNYVLPVCANLTSSNPRTLLALKEIAVQCARLDAGMENLAQRVDEAAAQGFQVALALDARNADAAETLSKSLGDRVARWDVDAGAAPDALAAIAKVIRRGGARAQIALVAKDPRALGAALEAGAGQYINAVVFRHNWAKRAEIAAVRAAAERAGYEGLALLACLSGANRDEAQLGPRLARQILGGLALEITQTGVDGSVVYGDDFGAGYVYLGALGQRLRGARYVGELPVGANIEALVFRAGAAWTLALWSVDAVKDVTLKFETGADLALFDARNNPWPVPALTDGALKLRVSGDPAFLTGKGGSILAQAAQDTIRKTADAFVASDEFKKRLPGDMIDIVKKFAASETKGYNRLDFFNLLKLFPRIEESWHTGGLSRSVAVPAMAALSRLARGLCVAEQERGEPFVEPLQSTMTNCGQYQSLYLTSSPATTEARERPEWLLAEVNRRMVEAQQLAAEGRGIEAGAVAALAEWRARALEFAAKAKPLSAPEEMPKPAAAAPAPAADKTEKKTKPPEVKPAPPKPPAPKRKK